MRGSEFKLIRMGSMTSATDRQYPSRRPKGHPAHQAKEQARESGTQRRNEIDRQQAGPGIGDQLAQGGGRWGEERGVDERRHEPAKPSADGFPHQEKDEDSHHPLGRQGDPGR
jgi:hypothetical protein